MSDKEETSHVPIRPDVAGPSSRSTWSAMYKHHGYLFSFFLFGGPEVLLRAGVEGPCLHRPENWLMKQLNEPKLVSKVGLIREKGKATAREAQRSPEAGSYLLR
jgi:hypothetical protein